MIVRSIDLVDLHQQHFACFVCRKAFKQPDSEETVVGDEKKQPRPFPCPECGQLMALMGRDFEAPPRRDCIGWIVAELLQRFGVIFEPGICGPGFRPRRLREAIDFLAEGGNDPAQVKETIQQIRCSRK